MSVTRQEQGNPGEQHPEPRGGAAFLLAQLGTHAAARFAERTAGIGLTPPLAGLLRAIAHDPGCSQQQLATRLGLLPSKMVALLDELESRGLAERERSTADRRQYALRLTGAGHATVRRIAAVARTHERDLCRGLDDAERATLVDLLGRIAKDQGLTPGVHPGFGRLGRRP